MTTTSYRTGPRAGQQIAAALGAARIEIERKHLAEELARWAGEEADAAHDAQVIEDGRSHGWLCCLAVREDAERNEYAFAMDLPLDKLRRRHASTLQERLRGLTEIEPPPRWEERAVDRARREGVLP